MVQQACVEHLVHLDLSRAVNNDDFIAISNLSRLTFLCLQTREVDLQAGSAAAVAFSGLGRLRKLELKAERQNTIAHLNVEPLTKLTSLELHGYAGSLAAAVKVTGLSHLLIATAQDRPTLEVLEAMHNLTQLTSLRHDGVLIEELNVLSQLPQLASLSCKGIPRISLDLFPGGPSEWYRALGSLTQLWTLNLSHCW